MLLALPVAEVAAAAVVLLGATDEEVALGFVEVLAAAEVVAAATGSEEFSDPHVLYLRQASWPSASLG